MTTGKARLRKGSIVALLAGLVLAAGLVPGGCHRPPPGNTAQTGTKQQASEPSTHPPSRPLTQVRSFDSERFPILTAHAHPWMFRCGHRLIACAWFDWAFRVFEIGELGGELSVFDYGQLPRERAFVDLACYAGSYYALLAVADKLKRPTSKTSLWRWNSEKRKFFPEIERMEFTGIRLSANADALFILEKESGAVYRFEPPTRPHEQGSLKRTFSLNRLLGKEGLGFLPRKLHPRLLSFQATSGGLLFAGVSTTRAQPEQLKRWILTTDLEGRPQAVLKLVPVKEKLTGQITDARFVPFAAGAEPVLAAYDHSFHWLDDSLQPLAERAFETSFAGDESYGPVPIDAATAFTWDNSAAKLSVLDFDLAQVLPPHEGER